jgi:hypothetical protein
MNPTEDEILERVLQQLQEQNLQGRVRSALSPVTGAKPESEANLIAQGYADQARQLGLGKPSEAEQDLAGTAAPMQSALLDQIEEDKRRKY